MSKELMSDLHLELFGATHKEEEKGGKELKTFKIPVYWEMCSIIHVEAESLEEAIEKAQAKEESADPYDLPTDGEYVDGTFEIESDCDYVAVYN